MPTTSTGFMPNPPVTELDRKAVGGQSNNPVVELGDSSAAEALERSGEAHE